MSKPFRWLWLGLLATLFAIGIFSCRAQADTIPINPTGPFFQIPSGSSCTPTTLTWTASGPCGIANAYTFAPLYVGGNACLYINNTGAALGTLTLAISALAFGTDAVGQAGPLQPVGETIITASGGTIYGTNGPLGVQPFSGYGMFQGTSGVATFSTSGASKITVAITGPAGATTAELVLVQMPSGAACGPQGLNNPIVTGLYSGNNTISSTGTVDLAFYCPLTAFVNAPGLGSTKIVQISTTFTQSRIRVCSVVWAQTPASSFKLNQGTGAGCATGPSDVSGTQPTTATSFSYIAGNQAPYTLLTGADLCFTLGTASTSGTVEVHYAIF